MKKTLVAVAAFAAITGAHAEATISGVLEAAVAKTSTGTGFGSGSNGGSEFTLSASEDLGNGLKAFGQFTVIGNLNTSNSAYTGVQATAGHSSATNTATGDTFGSYQNWIGLSGDFGSVKLGQFWSNTFLTSITGDVVSRSAFTNQLHGGAQGQIANAVNYTSPSFSGLSVSYTKAVDSTVAAEQYNDYSVNYSNGGLNLSYARGSLGTGTATKETILAGNYNFGMATLYIGSIITTASNTASTSGTSYGIAVPFGETTLSVGSGTASSNINNYQVLLNHNLSKRTRVYVHTANGTTAARPVTSQIGVRHNF